LLLFFNPKLDLFEEMLIGYCHSMTFKNKNDENGTINVVNITGTLYSSSGTTGGLKMISLY